MSSTASAQTGQKAQSLTLVQAVRDGLYTEMNLDDEVLVMGEDVGKNGGVFRATEGLWDEFGDDRVIDTPLAESGIVGTAIGMAAMGLKPVPEIQFSGFMYPGFDQLSQARFRTALDKRYFDIPLHDIEFRERLRNTTPLPMSAEQPLVLIVEDEPDLADL